MGLIPQPSSARELEPYNDIDLTPEERAEALRDARERKFYRLQEQRREAREAEVRRQLTEQWGYEKTFQFAKWRCGQLFGGQVSFEDAGGINCVAIFEILCLYFARDPAFVEKCLAVGVIEPSLEKGILLAGGIGRGKTTVMRVFQVNQRQVYFIKPASEIALQWRLAEKEAASFMDKYTYPFELPSNDGDNFYQRFAGLCIDDIGTEDLQNSYGNRSNVIADIIQSRYMAASVGPMLHLTTNMTMNALKEFYGSRVASRLRETVNIIELKGEDRRK